MGADRAGIGPTASPGHWADVAAPRPEDGCPTPPDPMDLSDRRTLARRLAEVDKALLAGFAAAVPDGEVDSVGGGLAVFTAPDWPMNRAVGFGLGDGLSAADIDALTAFYARRDAGAEVEMAPFDPPDTLARLGARGFRLAWQRTRLVRPLDPDAPADMPPAARVEPDAAVWSALAVRGFNGGRPASRGSFADRVFPIALGAVGGLGIVVKVDGVPAATAAVNTRHGIAALFGHATLPEARGRGGQTAAIAASVAVAASAGCRLAMVEADPGSTSERNLLRAGFRTVWTIVGLKRAQVG